jgi:putative transposase
MPRAPRADEAGGLYHALNRGNLGAEIFHKDEDYAGPRLPTKV